MTVEYSHGKFCCWNHKLCLKYSFYEGGNILCKFYEVSPSQNISTLSQAHLQAALDEVEVVPEHRSIVLSNVGAGLEQIHPTHCGRLTHLLADVGHRLYDEQLSTNYV